MNSINIIEGKSSLKDEKIAIVISRFNDFISEKLLNGAIDTLVRHGSDYKNIFVYRVPGSFEIPETLAKVISTNKFHGAITLGAVIRGSTPHFDYIASEVSKGVANISLKSDIPVVFGVLTTDTIEQAIERAGTKQGNKGADSALALIEMINLYKEIVK